MNRIVAEQSEAQLELAESLSVQLRAVVKKLKQRLREHSDRSDFTPSQTAVLLRLEADGAITVATLARVEGMRHQSMRTVAGPLLEAGLLRGIPDPNDKRQTLLSLTPKCLKGLESGRATRQDWLSRTIGEVLTSAEQERLRSSLKLLARIVEK